MDFCIDLYLMDEMVVMVEESYRRKIDLKSNLFGNFYGIEWEEVVCVKWIDVKFELNCIFWVENRIKINIVFGKYVGYKIVVFVM